VIVATLCYEADILLFILHGCYFVAYATFSLPLCFVCSHPPPAFGSSPNLEALALEANKPHNDEEDNTNASSRLLR